MQGPGKIPVPRADVLEARARYGFERKFQVSPARFIETVFGGQAAAESQGEAR